MTHYCLKSVPKPVLHSGTPTQLVILGGDRSFEFMWTAQIFFSPGAITFTNAHPMTDRSFILRSKEGDMSRVK